MFLHSSIQSNLKGKKKRIKNKDTNASTRTDAFVPWINKSDPLILLLQSTKVYAYIYDLFILFITKKYILRTPFLSFPYLQLIAFSFQGFLGSVPSLSSRRTNNECFDCNPCAGEVTERCGWKMTPLSPDHSEERSGGHKTMGYNEKEGSELSIGNKINELTLRF